jgi:hypothetical protein
MLGGCGCQIALVVRMLSAWKREVAPFEAMGASVVATGGGDGGLWAGREGVTRIAFPENVGNVEIASLARRMERFPNLHILILEGPKVTDASLPHLKRLKQLRTINLRNTKVTDKGKLELQNELPNLRGL